MRWLTVLWAIPQLWTVLAFETNWYQCIPGIEPSVGVSTPKGDIFLEHGSGPIDLRCHLNPDHSYVAAKGYNSKDLKFKITGWGENQEVIFDDIKVNHLVVNQTTIKSTFIPDEVGFFDVNCIVIINKDDSETPDENNSAKMFVDQDDNEVLEVGVCTQRIHVGYRPKPVTNFSCVSENWSNLNCTWTEPFNPVTTTYDVHFKEPGKWSPIKHCPNSTSLQEVLLRPIPKDLSQCYVDEKTEPQYRHVASRFAFIINATNPLLPKGDFTRENIDHFSIVRPGKPQSPNLESLSDNSLLLSYNVPNEMKNFPPGLVQEIKYSNQYEPEAWTKLNTIITKSDQKNNTFTILVPDLPYAWTNYTVRVRMLSAKAKAGDTRLWSDPAVVTGSTLARRPDTPPRTTQGSFEVFNYPTNRAVVVYWSQIVPQYHNGPGFRYDIVSVLENGEETSVRASEVTHSYAKFGILPSHSNFTFIVNSVNDQGSSPGSSRVFVPAKSVISSLVPRAVTVIYNSKDEIRISWFKPANTKHYSVVNYTLFWCPKEKVVQRRCDGLLEFATVNPDTKTVSDDRLEFEDDNNHDTLLYQVKLPPKIGYSFSVSANAEAGSSGMVWSTCSVLNDRMREGWVRDLTKEMVGDTWATLRWSLPCSERSGLVLKYIVTFCHDKKCRQETVDHVADFSVAKRLTNLEPWTNYRVNVTVVNIDKIGKESDIISFRTLASRPGSPPQSLSVDAVTNTSAVLSWSPPTKPNGPIAHYKLTLSDGSGIIKVANTSELYVEFSEILPYTEYSLEVAGCNVVHGDLCSQHPNTAVQTFRTLVGKPGKPLPPTPTFIGNNVTTIQWTDQFQLGAPQASLWEVRLVNIDPSSRVNNISKVEGKLREHSLILSELDDSFDIVTTCSNSSQIPTYNVSIRARVKNDQGQEFVGVWSDSLAIQPNCAEAANLNLIIAIGVVVPIVVCLLTAFIVSSCRYYKRKKDFFQKLGQELDERIITVTKTESRNDALKHYPVTKFNGKLIERANNDFSSDDRNDLMQTLLERNKSKSSDTTSGCESGHGSEQGLSLNSLNRSTSSNSSQADTDTEVPDTLHLNTADNILASVPHNPGYSRVKSMEPSQPGDTTGEGYINLSSPASAQPEPVSAAKPSNGYIQLPVNSVNNLAPGPQSVSSGYIQIQNVSSMLPPAPAIDHSGPAAVLEHGHISTPASLNVPNIHSLVRHSEDNPSYSKVSLVSQDDQKPSAVKAAPSTGYIQFPSNPVLISPNKLPDSSNSSRHGGNDPPQNTIV